METCHRGRWSSTVQQFLKLWSAPKFQYPDKCERQDHESQKEQHGRTNRPISPQGTVDQNKVKTDGRYGEHIHQGEFLFDYGCEQQV
jgi:hypothetical protein